MGGARLESLCARYTRPSVWIPFDFAPSEHASADVGWVSWALGEERQGIVSDCDFAEPRVACVCKLPVPVVECAQYPEVWRPRPTSVVFNIKLFLCHRCYFSDQHCCL